MKAAVKRFLCVFLLAFALIVCFAPTMSVSAEPASDRLSTVNQNLYYFLKSEITSVANGTKTSTEFKLSDPNGLLKWTKEELGVSEILFGSSISPEASYAAREKFNECVDLGRIINSLLADCPYEMFWYDKITGTSTIMSRTATSEEIIVTDITFKLAVSEDYASATYTTDPVKIAEASIALNNARTIVARHASKSDWDKLTAYKDEICQLVTYDHTASEDPDMPYGNPWQLINVFDNNASTNVVCEGYSKAFKLLCDLSTFEGDVSCYVVNGYMQGGTGAGGHMWNVVQIGGGTLLVDVTNCDAGTAGAPDQLFLKVGTKYDDVYAFTAGSTTIYYVYDQSEYDLHTDGYLELTPTTQQPSETECAHQWSTALTSDDPDGHYHVCSLCGEKDGFVAHTIETEVKKATLTTDGYIAEKCSICGYIKSTTAIARPTTFTLSTVNYTYNGQAKKPAVTVTDSEGKVLVNGTDYTVTYPSGRT
ncbi:MAG: hypothetical protein IJZ15_07625, partial [Oscillospiraceae bacterium]|nr:hypothetical protein [Oscillospiraceae bacterium]